MLITNSLPAPHVVPCKPASRFDGAETASDSVTLSQDSPDRHEWSPFSRRATIVGVSGLAACTGGLFVETLLGSSRHTGLVAAAAAALTLGTAIYAAGKLSSWEEQSGMLGGAAGALGAACTGEILAHVGQLGPAAHDLLPAALAAFSGLAVGLWAARAGRAMDARDRRPVGSNRPTLTDYGRS